jgi:hypothetical protein
MSSKKVGYSRMIMISPSTWEYVKKCVDDLETQRIEQLNKERETQPLKTIGERVLSNISAMDITPINPPEPELVPIENIQTRNLSPIPEEPMEITTNVEEPKSVVYEEPLPITYVRKRKIVDPYIEPMVVNDPFQVSQPTQDFSITNVIPSTPEPTQIIERPSRIPVPITPRIPVTPPPRIPIPILPLPSCTPKVTTISKVPKKTLSNIKKTQEFPIAKSQKELTYLRPRSINYLGPKGITAIQKTQEFPIAKSQQELTYVGPKAITTKTKPPITFQKIKEITTENNPQITFKEPKAITTKTKPSITFSGPKAITTKTKPQLNYSGIETRSMTKKAKALTYSPMKMKALTYSPIRTRSQTKKAVTYSPMKALTYSPMRTRSHAYRPDIPCPFPLCGMLFSTQDNLNRHLRISHNAKPSNYDQWKRYEKK